MESGGDVLNALNGPVDCYEASGLSAWRPPPVSPLMTSPIVEPALDRYGSPATLSRPIATGLL